MKSPFLSNMNTVVRLNTPSTDHQQHEQVISREGMVAISAWIGAAISQNIPQIPYIGGIAGTLNDVSQEITENPNFDGVEWALSGIAIQSSLHIIWEALLKHFPLLHRSMKSKAVEALSKGRHPAIIGALLWAHNTPELSPLASLIQNPQVTGILIMEEIRAALTILE